MRYLALCLLAPVLFSGCESVRSMPQNVREKFTGATYQKRVVSADQRKTYEAAKAALPKIGFQFIRGGPAQGHLEALNRISSGGPVTGPRQMSLDLKLTPVPEGTEIALLFNEIREDDFTKRPGAGSSTPMRDTLLYDSFFRHIEDGLGLTAPSSPPPAPK
jgi:hypothetical protein